MCCLLAGARAKQDPPAPPPIDRAAEANLKAVYVYQMCRFVRWPKEVFPPPDKPLVIGVMQNENLFKTLKAVAERRRIAERGLEIRELDKPADAAGCHLVILGNAMKPADQIAMIRQLGKKPVVVVAETDGMGKEGAHFNFFFTQKLEVHFEVNVKAAQASNLTIDPQLSALKFIRLLK